MYYTLNGTTPTTSSNLYSSPITISSTTTLKAITVDGSGNSSSVLTLVYTISETTTSPTPSLPTAPPSTTIPYPHTPVLIL
ncbi:chitobiase/beta-hexosaminidase C-terminal domain-containing protein [Clostridium sp.]|uniref:chitobiase/beta-hexosaminidase C-terminal domain-containing protein n=1 Tax=Clostridium sp. TaxID=1506 RepID=UPI00359F9CBE